MSSRPKAPETPAPSPSPSKSLETHRPDGVPLTYRRPRPPQPETPAPEKES